MITWDRYNNHLPNKAYDILIPSVTETTSVLTIPNVTSEDVGAYYCATSVDDKVLLSMAANLFLAGKTSE